MVAQGRSHLRFPFRVSVFLALTLATLFAVHLALRLTGLLGPGGLRWLQPVSFVLLWLTPFLVFLKQGRIAMGFHRPKGWYWLPFATFVGFGSALTAYWVGYTFFGTGGLNWFISVKEEMLAGVAADDVSRETLFWIITVPLMIFSPLGEELFFRGVMDQSIREEWGGIAALLINSGLFAAVHLFHHGIYFAAHGPIFLGTSALIWFAMMMSFAVLMTVLRRASASIWTSVIAHAAFNFGMAWTIFRYLME